MHELVAVHSSTIPMTSTDRVHERVEPILCFHGTCAMVKRNAYARCGNISLLGVGPQWVVFPTGTFILRRNLIHALHEPI